MNKPKTIVKECNTHGYTEFVLEGRGYYRCKKCRSAAVQKRRVKVKDDLVSHFGGKCQSCDYVGTPWVFEFHHVDSEEKEFAMAKEGHTRSFAKMLAEAIKCVLVCCRCHREIHAGVRECPPLLFNEGVTDA